MPKVTINGWVKLIAVILTIAGTLIAVGITYATLSGGVETNCKDIAVIKPKVERNTEYRLQRAIDDQYIKRRLDNIETTQKEILDEVRR